MAKLITYFVCSQFSTFGLIERIFDFMKKFAKINFRESDKREFSTS